MLARGQDLGKELGQQAQGSRSHAGAQDSWSTSVSMETGLLMPTEALVQGTWMDGSSLQGIWLGEKIHLCLNER